MGVLRVKMILAVIALGFAFYQVAVTGPGLSHTDIAIAGLALIEAITLFIDVFQTIIAEGARRP